ncbi:negative elongation factor E-like [Anneissia japonica]|uniref:negative elongation factor E-like n=1 Tax=Anneissia japonica TaxID=1529436 RepID=UPI0014256618|nr:negative elongation factor E-like [Anneissia japonica]
MKMIFPSRLTEEEEILQQKFALLKKKRRALHLLKQAKNKPPTESQVVKPKGIKRTVSEVSQEEAKETAKKVLLSQSALTKVKESGFKRSKHFEKKTKDSDKCDKSGVVAFEPFNGAATEDAPPTPGKERRSSYRPLYESFVSSSDRYSRKYNEADSRPSYPDLEPKRGNTIYVKGYNMLSEEICKEAFHKFGNILNMNLEKDKNVAFVTFEKIEAADQAIKEMDKAIFRDVKLKVSFARRQPVQENAGDSSFPWGDVSFSRTKPKHKDQRPILRYDEDEDLFSS